MYALARPLGFEPRPRVLETHMLPLHQRRIIAFVLGKAITDNFHCPTSPLILLRSKFAYATEDKAQPLYAGRLALELPCSIYIAEI